MAGKKMLADLTPAQRKQAFGDYRERMMRAGDSPNVDVPRPDKTGGSSQATQDEPLPGVTTDQDILESCVAAVLARRSIEKPPERKPAAPQPPAPTPLEAIAEREADDHGPVRRRRKHRDMYPSRNADQPPGPGLLRWITRKLNLK